MVRRDVLGAFGAGAAGLMTLGVAPARGQDEKKHGHDQHGHGGHEVLAECARICNENAAHCLKMVCEAAKGDQEAGARTEMHAKAHAASMDCQAFCHLASALTARESLMAKYAHAACADACRDCAKACEPGEDEVMKRCAEICRRCEEHCRKMADAGAPEDRAAARR